MRRIFDGSILCACAKLSVSDADADADADAAWSAMAASTLSLLLVVSALKFAAKNVAAVLLPCFADSSSIILAAPVSLLSIFKLPQPW